MPQLPPKMIMCNLKETNLQQLHRFEENEAPSRGSPESPVSPWAS